MAKERTESAAAMVAFYRNKAHERDTFAYSHRANDGVRVINGKADFSLHGQYIFSYDAELFACRLNLRGYNTQTTRRRINYYLGVFCGVPVRLFVKGGVPFVSIGGKDLKIDCFRTYEIRGQSEILYLVGKESGCLIEMK